ncbi:MAG TPA: DUF3566 domain-containing protein [Marmoricola sp.]
MANRRRPVVPPKAGVSSTEAAKPVETTQAPTGEPSKKDQAAERRKAAAERRAQAAEARKKAAEEKAAAKAKEQADQEVARTSAQPTAQPAQAVSSSAIKRPAKPAQSPAAVTAGSTRTARLRLVHVDPWSVMKTAFLLSIALGIVMIVAVTIVWGVLGAAGVWDSINSSVRDTVGSDTSKPFNITDYIGAGRVIGFTMVAAVIDVVVLTALATLGAFVYNLAATLLGGVEMTLAEDR